MKAIFNENREILGIGENVYDEANRSDWIEISGGDDIDYENLWAGGQGLYTIDESGVVTEDPDAKNIIKGEKKLMKLEAKHARKAAMQAIKDNENLNQKETELVDAEIARLDAISGDE